MQVYKSQEYFAVGSKYVLAIISSVKCPLYIVSLLCTTVLMQFHLPLSKQDFKVSHDRQGFTVRPEQRTS